MYGISRYGAPRIWREMARLSEEMNRHFAAGEAATKETCCVFPPINFYEDGESFVVRAEIPGVKPEHLEINATGDTLTIKGERHAETHDEKISFHRRERDHGVFNRSFRLPEPINADKVLAKLEHGILEVMLPKAEEARPRKINVEA